MDSIFLLNNTVLYAIRCTTVITINSLNLAQIALFWIKSKLLMSFISCTVETLLTETTKVTKKNLDLKYSYNLSS